MKRSRLILLGVPVLWAGALFLASIGYFHTHGAGASLEGPDLALISEMTGSLAAARDIGQGCVLSAEYGVYLCEQNEPEQLPIPDAAARTLAARMVVSEGLLLIPDSSTDRVMAFDPVSGSLIDADFIPADPTNLSTPLHAIPSPNGDSILVSDQLEDVVQEYDLAGNYVGVFAPAGGANTAILDNIRGLEVTTDGRLLVTVGSGSNADAIVAFDGDGNHLGNFVANGAGGLDSPFDILERADDFLVAAITSDAIHRYDGTGSALTDFAAVDGFPEQQFEMNNGNVLVGNFAGSEEGVIEYDSDGLQLGIYDVATLGGYRGAYALGNGNILTTNGGGVHEIDRTSTLIESEISGVSSRFIQFIQAGMTMTQTVQLGASGCGGDQVIFAEPGDMVTFCYTMTNIGHFQWISHTLTDTLHGELMNGVTAIISPGASISIEQNYLIPGTDGDTINNCATWVASNPAFTLSEGSCTDIIVGSPTDVALTKFAGQANSGWLFWAAYALLTAAGTVLLIYRRPERRSLIRLRDSSRRR